MLSSIGSFLRTVSKYCLSAFLFCVLLVLCVEGINALRQLEDEGTTQYHINEAIKGMRMLENSGYFEK